jgi:CheY-like chemotaxis protein
MKILFLNRHLHDAPILASLRKLGVGVLLCGELQECELVHRLHSSSVTLFVGHDDEGVRMNSILKSNPRYAKTPVILTTSKWSDQQCIDHQASPEGANAYIRLPVDDKDFIRVIDAILGSELAHGKGFLPSDELPVSEDATVLSVMPSGDFELEDAAAIFGKTGEVEAGGISLGDPSAVSLDSPSIDLATKEFQIETNDSRGDEAVAERIEPTSEPETEFSADLASVGFVEVPPIFEDVSPAAEGDEGETRVAAVALDDAATRVAMVFEQEAATRVATPFDDGETRVEISESLPSASAPARAVEKEDLDEETLATMPYLGRDGYANLLDYREPMDDAVVPGGAANAPDVETLKKYLYLREQDVSALSAQLRQAREQIASLETQLRHEKAVSTEFAHLAQEQDRRIGGFEKEKIVALEEAEKEIESLKSEMRRRSEKIRVMEMQVKEAAEATERLKERVRNDIRKIRSREKELENRLEIMKKDSEALLGAREQKIIDLKRKLDLMEFNSDLLQDQLEKERKDAASLREKLAKAAQIVRVAGGLLSPEEEALLINGEESGKDRVPAA